MDDKGDTGSTGLQGIQGIQGVKGDKGEKGDKGDAFTFNDFTPTQISELQKPATDKVVELNELDANLFFFYGLVFVFVFRILFYPSFFIISIPKLFVLFSVIF